LITHKALQGAIEYYITDEWVKCRQLFIQLYNNTCYTVPVHVALYIWEYIVQCWKQTAFCGFVAGKNEQASKYKRKNIKLWNINVHWNTKLYTYSRSGQIYDQVRDLCCYKICQRQLLLFFDIIWLKDPNSCSCNDVHNQLYRSECLGLLWTHVGVTVTTKWLQRCLSTDFPLHSSSKSCEKF
jgi:hypothetical protein